jgi:HNH endonuclease
MINQALYCQICDRAITERSYWDEHHLIPVSKNGRYTERVKLHRICHEKIHSIFTEAELASYYNTVDRLLTNEDMRKFVKWVKKKPPEFYTTTKKQKR